MSAASADPHRRGRAGAPLRFLGLTLGMWVGTRVLAGSLLAPLPDNGSGLSGPAGWAQPSDKRRSPLNLGENELGGLTAGPARRLVGVPILRRDYGGLADTPVTTAVPALATEAASLRIRVANASPISFVREGRAGVSVAAANGAASPPQEGHDRWSASAWLFWRSTAGRASLSSAGQLGGAQAGMRIERRLGQVRGMPIAAYARMTTGLSEPMAPEAAVGLAVRPLSGKTPVIFGIERRVAFDRNGRNAYALMAVGGLNPTPVVGPFTLEGYAQAGMVGFARRDPFIDGRMSLTAPLRRGGGARVGLSVSGGAQPGASRLDLGPVFETRLPFGAVRPRLTLEWRQRIAGKARPDSGVAVTLANDF